MRTTKVLYDPKLSQLDLLVTEKCNLNCVYCFHKQRPMDMTDEIVSKCLDMLKDQIRETAIFNFFGGEPMLREHFCIDWMHRIRERFPKCRFHFTTNGTIYSERLVKEFLVNEPPILQLSHDGINQSKLRGMDKEVSENLKRYLAAVSPSKVTVRLTFTENTVGDLARNLSYFYDMGVRRFAHQADVNNNWTDKNVQEYCNQVDKMYEFQETHTDIDIVFCNCNRLMNSGSIQDGRQCNMGRELLSLSADGSLYPCHRAVKFPQFKVGDVLTGGLNRGKFPVLCMDGCIECNAKTTCHQCFLANYEHNGSLEIPVKSGCGINLYENKKLSEKYDLITLSYEKSQNLIAKAVAVLDDIKSNNESVLAELK